MKRIVFPILAVMLHVCNVWAQDGWKEVPDAGAVVEAFNAASAGVSSIDCLFTEEKYVDVLEEKSVSSGRFMFCAPDRILIEYLSPQQSSICIDGDSMTITSGVKTSSVDLASNRQYQRMFQMFSGKGDKKGRMPQVKVYEKDGRYLLTFPMKQGGISGVVEAIVDSSDMSLESFRMTSGTDYTEFRFTDRKFGTIDNPEAIWK